MTTIQTPVDNGVNVEALLGVREALADTPEKARHIPKVLAELGAEFFFDGAAIRPGKPVVFGRARGKFFFGLPGNPLSAMRMAGSNRRRQGMIPWRSCASASMRTTPGTPTESPEPTAWR